MFSRSFPFFIASRYLKPSRRNRFLSFITAIAIVGVTLGTCALLISLSILRGYDETLRTTIIDFMGHIEISGYYANDSLVGGESIGNGLRGRIPEIKAISPFVRREAIIRSSKGLEGVLLKGMESTEDISAIRETVIAGEFLSQKVSSEEGALPPLVIGKRLADRLFVGLGDTVVLFIAAGVPDVNTPPLIEQFVVTGVYRSGMAQYDDIYVFTTIQAARQLLQYSPDIVSGFDVMLSDPEKIGEVVQQIRHDSGGNYWAESVFELFSSIFAWIDLQRMLIPIVMAIIAVVATFNVISILLMTVLEKTESIGTLATIGASPRTIMKIFVSKGVLVTSIGVFSGAALTLIFSILQLRYGLIGLEADIYIFESVPIAIDPLHYIVVILGTILLAMLATLIPAAIASRLRPVMTLRFQ
ncbi:MAG: ABC transporter permease [Candidatus Kapaibacterium sp.]